MRLLGITDRFKSKQEFKEDAESFSKKLDGLSRSNHSEIIREIRPKARPDGSYYPITKHDERLLSSLKNDIKYSEELANLAIRRDNIQSQLNDINIDQAKRDSLEKQDKNLESQETKYKNLQLNTDNELTGPDQKKIIQAIENNKSLIEAYEKSYPEQGKRFTADINSLKGKARSLSTGETEKLGKCEKELAAFHKVIEAENRLTKAKEANKRGETGAARELAYAKEYLERKQNNLKEAQDIASGLKNPGYASRFGSWFSDKVGQVVGKDAMAKLKSAGDDFSEYAKGNNDIERAVKMFLRLLMLMLELLVSQVVRLAKFVYHSAFPIKDRANDSSDPSKGSGLEMSDPSVGAELNDDLTKVVGRAPHTTPPMISISAHNDKKVDEPKPTVLGSFKELASSAGKAFTSLFKPGSGYGKLEDDTEKLNSSSKGSDGHSPKSPGLSNK